MVGRPDKILGEIVVAVVVYKNDNITNNTNTNIDTDTNTQLLNNFLKTRLTSYKRPKVTHTVAYIPRNAMGKVNKKTLLKDLGL